MHQNYNLNDTTHVDHDLPGSKSRLDLQEEEEGFKKKIDSWSAEKCRQWWYCGWKGAEEGLPINRHIGCQKKCFGNLLWVCFHCKWNASSSQAMTQDDHLLCPTLYTQHHSSWDDDHKKMTLISFITCMKWTWNSSSRENLECWVAWKSRMHIMGMHIYEGLKMICRRCINCQSWRSSHWSSLSFPDHQCLQGSQGAAEYIAQQWQLHQPQPGWFH